MSKYTMSPMPTQLSTGPMPACRLCGKALAYAGAVYCGSACCARWEAGERPKVSVKEIEER